MKKIFCFLFCLWFGLFPALAKAASIAFPRGAILRDAECENALRNFLEPILEAMKLDVNSVKIFLIHDHSLNAVTIPGPVILVHTGLVLRCQKPEELIGVIAHEAGHARAQHLVTRLEAYQKARQSSMITFGLGSLITLLTGGIGGILMGGLGVQIGTNNFLSFTRDQEMQADLLAYQALKKTNWPTSGLLSFFEKLKNIYGPSSAKTTYLQTHPSNEERINMARKNLNPSATVPSNLATDFYHLQTKIKAYTQEPSSLIEESTDPYAKAIAYYRMGYLDKAEELLIKEIECKKSPYLDELLAEIALEKAAFPKALAAVNRCLKKLKRPHSQIYVLKARILLAMEDHKAAEIPTLLQKAALLEPSNPDPWYFLSIFYGKQNKNLDALVCLAERNARLGHFDIAEKQIKKIRKHLLPQSKLARQIDDLSRSIDEQKKVLKTIR